MFRRLFANLRKISKVPATSTSTTPGTRRISTSATNDATPTDTADSVLKQEITNDLKEFLSDYERRTKEANLRMEQSIMASISFLHPFINLQIYSNRFCNL